jgi:hypothetical protein
LVGSSFQQKAIEGFRFANLFFVSVTGVGLQKGAAVSLDGCNRRTSDDQSNCWFDGKAKCAFL